MIRSAGRFLFGLFLLFCLTVPAFAGTSVPSLPYRDADQQAEAPQNAPAAVQPSGALPAASSNKAYVLGIGDKIKLVVYGEDDLSGDYEVSSTGIVSLPLIGEVRAAGLTLQTFETSVRQKLREGYLRDPRVSIQVSNYRPFFILGEVSKPGSYPYANGMNVLNAVAMAGGYTYRADKSEISVVHAGDASKKEHAIAEEDQVLPGDILRVPERLF